jgi:protein-tyrosine-phosphatase
LKNVLFVCTGNTCRSPMAEALFRELVRDRADYQVASAGVAAAPGMPASKHTTALLTERGLDLSGFQSRMLDREALEQATHVFAMSSHHMAAIADEFPEQVDKFTSSPSSPRRMTFVARTCPTPSARAVLRMKRRCATWNACFPACWPTSSRPGRKMRDDSRHHPPIFDFPTHPQK